MSYTTWHEYGYGICTDDIKIESTEMIEVLLNHAPNYRKVLHDYFALHNITEPTVENYTDAAGEIDFGYCGLASLLKKAIEEAEGINMCACNDFDGCNYLIYQPSYPWEITEKDRTLTKEKLEEIFSQYGEILTDEFMNVDFQDVENGG